MEPTQINDSFIDAPISAMSHTLNPLLGVDNNIDRKHINILAYNVFLRPPFVKNNESDHKDARLKEIIRLLGNYDIVCLEEMFGFLNRRKHKLIRCATKAGFLHYAESSSPSFFTTFLVDGGLLMLSRFPIVEQEFKPYPYGIFSDALSQKGILYGKIQIKDEHLHIFHTHMQASYFGETQKYPILTRSDQFQIFRKFIDHCLKKYDWQKGEKIILLGDFNVDSRKPLIETSKVRKYSGLKMYPHLARGEMFDEYEAMMCLLSDNKKDEIKDLLLETYEEHPITYADSYLDGEGELKPLETVLTDKDDLCSNQSLDYILEFIPKGLQKKRSDTEDLEIQNLSKKGKLMIRQKSAQVEKMFIENKEFTQLSDHYAVSVQLDYVDDILSDRSIESTKERINTTEETDFSLLDSKKKREMKIDN